MRWYILKKTFNKALIFLFVLFIIIGGVIGFFFFYETDLSRLDREQEVSSEVSNIHSHYNLNGDNIKIAVIDSGISKNHKDLSDNIIGGKDFINGLDSTVDKYGHGTQVAGIIAAEDNSIGVLGVAPQAKIYSLVVLNEEGKGKIEDVCQAIKWCIENKMDIINISFSTKKDSDDLRNIIDKAVNKGILVIACYNNNDQSRSFPAEYNNVIGVKSSDDKSIAYKDGVCYAPGTNILTTSKEGGYEYINGNSMATAYISGLAGLVKQDYLNKDIPFNYDSFQQVLIKW